MSGSATCLCCEVVMHNGAQELHHFPIPKRHGGTETVPLCRGCHDKIDRFALTRWGPYELMAAVVGLVEKANASERAFLLKVVSLFYDATDTLKGEPA